jgi:C4-dicarboxylate transporter, DctQ subunit
MGNLLRRGYEALGKVEEAVVVVFISFITFLIFVSAMTRTFGYPLNWAVDLSLLMFAWVVFLGADVALRHADFIRFDLVIKRLPQVVQKVLYYLYNLMAIGFFGLIIYYGFPLAFDNAKRLFQTLGVSYLWATLSAPVGSILLIITIIVKLVDNWGRKEVAVVEGSEAI